MAPIRVGIIGLSKGWAANAHLPYLKRSEHYQIVAVQNSSVESAKRAIETLELGEGVKAYGDSEDIAADENVDLVVCSVRVDRHNSTISPSLRKGKNVFVEWPLGKSLADAEELLKLKNESGVKNDFVGLQARQDPIINTLKHLLATNAIGDILSSTWTCYASQGGPTTIETIEYLGRKEVGGNLVTIHLGHAIDFIQHAFGSYFKTNPNENDISSLLAARRPFITLLSNDGKTVLSDHHPKTSDDTIFVQGTLPGTLPEKQIPISITLLGGPVPTFSGIPGLDWRIHGTKGNLRITASGPFLQIGYPDSKIERQDLESGEVEVVEVKTAEGEEKWIEELPMPARNVGRIYEGIKEVLRGGDSGAPPGYGEGLLCTFEDAVERHRILERL